MAGPINRVVVLCGGSSLERSVSLVTGHESAKALSQQGYEVLKIDTKEKFLDQLINFNPKYS